MALTPEDAKRQLLRGRIEVRRQLEKKSLRSIEALLEKNITEVELLDHCKNLWQQSYQDCTEERALGELCGYPLCDNPVVPQTKKLPTYRISLRNKKVYSNEKQRVFCGVQCYERSEWLKSQLSEVPLWMLETPFRNKISLHRRHGDPPGDRTFDGNVLPNTQRVSVHEIEKISQDIEKIPLQESAGETVKICVAPILSERVPRPLPAALRDSGTSEILSVDRIETLLCEWFTIGSLHHIVGQDRFLELRAKYDRGFSGADRSVDDMMEKFSRLCSFLDQQEKLEGITYSDDDEEKTENAPQLKDAVAKTAAKQMRRKRVSFKSGESSRTQTEIPDTAALPGNLGETEPVLPPVDKHEQELLREKILLEKLSALVETSSGLMRSPAHLLAKDVSQLIHTFHLTRDNCLVREHEIAVVFVAIMMLLDRRAGGEGRIPQDVQFAFDAAIRGVGLGWGDITVALRKATDPQRLFNPRGELLKPTDNI